MTMNPENMTALMVCAQDTIYIKPLSVAYKAHECVESVKISQYLTMGKPLR